MTPHQWKKDKDGAESCEREGCMVRHNPAVSMWQKKPGGHWRGYAPRHRPSEPIPPCTGKDVDAPAPSPLEVVREALTMFQNMGGTVWAEERQAASDSLNALATLEESIRADERERCAQVADAQEAESNDMERETTGQVAFGWESRAAGSRLIAFRIRNRP